ncbi:MULTISPECIES: amidohydrolase [Methanobacterium]|nr:MULTISPECIES: amidohydrolase [Methanobacterium]
MKKSTTETEEIIAFTGGQILTMDPEKKNAEVVVIQNGRIIDVGDKSILKSYAEFELINIKGKTLIPAFIDAHNHLSWGCLLLNGINLRGILKKEDVLHKITDYARENPGNGWIIAYPWMDVQQGGDEFTKEDIDNLNLDRPVLLIHHSFHKSVANSKALKLAGIGKSTQDPSFGNIVKDNDGNPTGLMMEHAQFSLFRVALESKTEINTKDYADLIEARANELLSFGITSVQDPGVTPAAEAAYKLLHNEDRLPVSVLMMPHGEVMLDNQGFNCADKPCTGFGDERLRVGPLKLFADGGVHGFMAFAGEIGGETYEFGRVRDDFESKLIEATQHGFRVCVHSIGNAATDAVLDSFENAVSKAPEGFEMRPRLEHLFLMSDDQIKRLASMGGCSAVQACFLEGSQGLKEIPFKGLKWFAFRDMVQNGVVLAGSSDDPGGFMDGRDPVTSSVMGANMSDNGGNVLFPDQTLSFEKWLEMYTAGAAYAGGLEKERGMLKKGLAADLVILEGDLDQENPPVVAETWKTGRKVYSRV